MEKLHVAQTISTPLIDFDPGRNLLVVQGQSYPEDSFKFYEPVLKWLDAYLSGEADSQVHVELSLTYVNTSSSKCIMLVLDALERAHETGRGLQLKWLCNKDNEFEQECAEEFKEDYTFPFEIVLT